MFLEQHNVVLCSNHTCQKKKGHLCDLLLAIMKLQRQQVWHLWLWHLLVVIHLVPQPPATVTALAESDHRRPGLVNPFRSRGASLQIQPQYGPGLDTDSISFIFLLVKKSFIWRNFFVRIQSTLSSQSRIFEGFFWPCLWHSFRNFRDT